MSLSKRSRLNYSKGTQISLTTMLMSIRISLARLAASCHLRVNETSSTLSRREINLRPPRSWRTLTLSRTLIKKSTTQVIKSPERRISLRIMRS